MNSQQNTAYAPQPAPLTIAELPGISVAGVAAGIKPSGRPDVALLVTEEIASAAAVFTKNAFAAAPVTLSRRHLAESHGRVRAVVVNSGNANACTGERGARHAAMMAERVAQHVGCTPREVIVASTGVIGVELPIERVLDGIDRAHASLSTGRAASESFLAAMMTTDAFPKAWGERGGPTWGVAGVCKGAGMIEPNMATMLSIVATDLSISADVLAAEAARALRTSFNAIHVDSHTSTNDMFLLLATERAGFAPNDWRSALSRTCDKLAWLIARDGEGATKVCTIRVSGAPSSVLAEEIARLIAHSALVRTALFGNDPNWGRFVSAAGNHPALPDPSRLVCRLAGVVVFERGEPTRFDRAALSQAMRSDDLSLEIELGAGDGHAVVLTSDLGYRYVEVNAEYTT
ncbi:MAG: bifunctional glutamate N-acetyltransferase/amino-acid acetyltransferase ArgJ [Polyangiaceae bacterium]